MGANKYENFEVEVVNRKKIHGAEYNPRKISAPAKKKLHKFLKKHGLWCPLIWNKQTGNLVSGHQRLGILDDLLGVPDYEMTVSVVDVDEKMEISGNVFFNNSEAQGEWDFEILSELKGLGYNFDYVNDFGFEPESVEIMFSDDSNESALPPEEIEELPVEQPENVELSDEEKQYFRDLKKKNREKAKSDNEDGNGTSLSKSDFHFSVVFPDAETKRAFLEMIHCRPKEQRISSGFLTDYIENLKKGRA